MPRDELLAVALELPGDLAPREALLDQPPPGQADRPAPIAILQEADHRLGKFGRAVGLEEVPLGGDVRALGAGPCRYDGLPQAHRPAALEPRAPARPYRRHADRRVRNLDPA